MHCLQTQLLSEQPFLHGQSISAGLNAGVLRGMFKSLSIQCVQETVPFLEVFSNHGIKIYSHYYYFLWRSLQVKKKEKKKPARRLWKINVPAARILAAAVIKASLAIHSLNSPFRKLRKCLGNNIAVPLLLKIFFTTLYASMDLTIIREYKSLWFY